MGSECGLGMAPQGTAKQQAVEGIFLQQSGMSTTVGYNSHPDRPNSPSWIVNGMAFRIERN